MVKYNLLLLMIAAFLGCNQNKTKTVNTKPDTAAPKPLAVNQQLIAGKRAGNIKLNEDIDSAINILGKPDRGDAAMGAQSATWFNNKDSNSYQTQVYAHRNMGAKDENISRIKLVRITSPWYQTPEHLQIGSSLTEISKYYKVTAKSDYTEKDAHIKVYNDARKGIGFEIDSVSQKCVGIIISAPGDSLIANISLHNNSRKLK